jgi:hypothetical protein
MFRSMHTFSMLETLRNFHLSSRRLLSGISVTQSIVFCAVCRRTLLVFFLCSVCPSIYGF